MSSNLLKDKENSFNLSKRLEEFGITRLADTTGLDYINIPTSSCVCPGTTDAIWVYSGKGTTPERSRISAIMECVERTSSLWNEERIIISDYSTLSQKSIVWEPTKFTESISSHYSPNEPIAWIEGTHLWKDCSVWIPADLAFNGHRPQLEVPNPFLVSTSNGLGAGFSLEQATTQALGELIERDAVSCMELRASHFGAAYILNLARFIGKEQSSLLKNFQDNTDLALTINLESLPQSAIDLYKKFQDANLDIQIKYIPNDFNVPVFGAAAVEMMSFDSVLAAAGYGISLNPEEAICRALLELAQSRATDRQGVREDCGCEEKDRHSDIPSSHWLAEPGSKSTNYEDIFAFQDSKVSSKDDFLARLKSSGLDDAAVVNFNTYKDIFVVRAIVPEIETWHATGGVSRVGQRMSGYFTSSVN